ncbi:hypothetical protein [Vibrio harveyi]
MIYFHKLMLIGIFFIGLVWTCIALDTYPFVTGLWDTIKLTYIIIGTIAFWGGAYLLGVQFLYIRFKYKNKILYKYAVSIQKDIVVSLITSIVLSSVYWLDKVDYDFNGIDLGFIGIPFGIASFYALFQMLSIKVGGERLQRKPIMLILAFLLIIYGIACYLLLENLGGSYTTAKALWIQITILCFSFVAFLNTHLMLVFAQEGQVVIPEFQKSVLKGFNRDADAIISNMEEPVEKLNKALKGKKAKYSSNLRRQNKK